MVPPGTLHLPAEDVAREVHPLRIEAELEQIHAEDFDQLGLAGEADETKNAASQEGVGQLVSAFWDSAPDAARKIPTRHRAFPEKLAPYPNGLYMLKVPKLVHDEAFVPLGREVSRLRDEMAETVSRHAEVTKDSFAVCEKTRQVAEAAATALKPNASSTPVRQKAQSTFSERGTPSPIAPTRSPVHVFGERDTVTGQRRQQKRIWTIKPHKTAVTHGR